MGFPIAITMAIFGAIAFLFVQRRPYFTARPYIKAIMALALAAYCLTAVSAPLYIMAIGFMLSALGDFLLDLPEDRGFVLGLAAFLSAHVAFIIAIFAYLPPLTALTTANWALAAATIAASVGFYLWILPKLDKGLKIPVGAYSIVIAIMGVVAFNTTSHLALKIGALLFILSDMVLAIAKFATPFPGHKPTNWILYSSGQILLAVGIVYACVLCHPA